MRSVIALATLLAGCGSGQNIGKFNVAPSVSITGPPDGATFDEGEVVSFEALVDDDFDEGDALDVRWSSDKDGEFSGPFQVQEGYTRYQTANLSSGNHVITVQVVDSEGKGSQDAIALVINDLPEAPEVSMVHPATGESGVEGELFEFVARVTDSRDAPIDIAISFESNEDGVFCEPAADEVGVASCEVALSAGDHLLTFSATDPDGYTGQATGYFAVTARTAIDDDGDGYSEDEGDCDDADGSVNPGATEYYNSRDDDCDGVVDNGTEGYDDDGDGYSEVDGDCDDTDDDTFPGATEICDGVDNDCDGTVDEDTVCYDDDGDGWMETDGDCDDDNAATYPLATELEDGEDNDCDGVIDEGTDAYDDDGDSYTEHSGDCDDDDATIHPGATEVCDGVDNDCDSSVDEQNATGCSTYYRDYDGDGYGSTTSACLCAPTGYYTSAYNTDCYDYNVAANPGATSWQTNDRGDGSFDYNCDGSQTRRYTASGGCGSWPTCNTSAGWASTTPSCGGTSNYVTSCSTDVWFSCTESTTSRTQSCY